MRRLVKNAVGLIGLLVLALLLGRGALELPSVRAWLAVALSEAFTSRDVTVTIEGLDGSLPFAPSATRVEIADRGGIWLTIEGVHAEVAPLPLVGRELHVRAIAAERVTIARLPLPDDDPFKLRPFRLGVRVDELDAREILLGRELLEDGDAAEAWSAPITVHASGSVDLRRLTLDVVLSASTLDAGTLTRRTKIDAREARLSAALRGAIQAPGGEATLRIADLAYADARADAVEIRATAERLGMGERRYLVEAKSGVRGLRGASPALQNELGAEPSLTGAVRFGESPRVFDLERLTLAGATFAADLVGAADGSDEIAISSFAVTWPDLAAIPEARERLGAGTLRARGRGKLRLAGGGGSVSGSAELTLEADGLVLHDPRLDALVGATPSLSMKLAADSTESWTADDLVLVGAGLRASGKGRFDAASDHVGADVAFSLPDLAPVGEGTVGVRLAGGVDGTLALDGVPSALSVRSTLRPQSLRIGASPVVGGALDISATGSAAAATASVGAALTLGGTPVSVTGSGRYSKDKDLLGIDKLTIVSRATTAEAKGEITLGSRLATGSVHLTSKDLSTLATLLDLKAAGRLEARVDLAHDGRTQTLRLTADGSELSVAGVLDAPISAATLALEGEVRDATGRRDGRLDAHATRVAWRELDLVAIDIGAERKGGKASFRADTSGAYRGDLALEVAGHQAGDLERGTLTFDRISGVLRGHTVESSKPLELELRRREVAVRSLALAVDSGGIEGAWSAGGVRGTGSIRATDLPLDLTALVIEGADLDGSLSGEISRPTRGDDLSVRARSTNILHAQDEVDGTGAERAIAVDMTARAGAWRSHVDARIVASDDASALTAAADLPFGFIGGRAGAPLSGRIQGSLAPELLGDLVLPDNERLTGKLDVDVALGGTLAAPLLNGRTGGQLRYTSGTTGMELRIDEIELRANGRAIELVSLRGSDGRKGQLQGEGKIELPSGTSPSHYDLAVAFTDTVVARLDSIDLLGDGSLSLRGPGDALVLGGSFSADVATIRLPDSLPPDVVTLPVEHVNLAAARSGALLEEAPPRVESPIALDLAVDFPSRLRVEDPDLDSEWRGKLFVRGDTAKPDIQGELVVVRGRFDPAGVRFNTTEGRLYFEEATNIPQVDLTMVANRHEVEATLRVQGPADRPSIDLTSTPPLPQDEILSRLMFGESAGTLTAGQSVQLAQAASRLSGHGPGLGSTLLARVRRFAHVDRIAVEDSGDPNEPTTAVTVGKYVGDRIYVSYDQVVQGQGSKARVEVEMTKHLSAETEVGQNENASVGLKWRWNY